MNFVKGDQNGNISGKSDAGTYSYDNSRVNAVTDITGNYGTIPQTFQSVAYNAFNLTDSVTQNPYKIEFTYGPDNQRIKSVLANGPNPVKTKYYSYNYEKEIKPSGTREINYINSPYGLVAVVVKENNIYTPYYVETDHLGSIIGLLNNDGTYAERYSFDAWGRRRNPTDWSYDNIPAPTILDRGYTGHEHLDVFSLIKMLSGANRHEVEFGGAKSRERSDSGNGRMYDPVLGRFLGADPVLQDQGNSQSFNGYSYCLNNPMKYSDF